MRFLSQTGRVIVAAFGLAGLQSQAWTAPAAVPPAGTAAKPSFVAPRAIPSSAMKNWPVYPPAARQAHREGVVLLSVKISAQGAPLDVKLAKSSSFPDLDAAAVAAVRNWQFTPATSDGAAIETTVNLPINFSLKTAEKPQPAQVQDKPKPKPKVAQHKPAAKPKAKAEAPKPDDASPPAEPPAKEAN
ncbi:energy transducer TonB [Methyloferula stellata]|uniref:energy transducer TonB n=1 Tax=Methyloferula stellata TaxID=876270 RepID=UPI000365E1E6|nr:energy transducer TonB [Methyloferula stellata]